MWHGNAAVRAGQFLGIDPLRAPHYRNGHQALRKFQRGGDGVLQAAGDPGLDQQAVHDHFDGVVLPLVQARRAVQRVELAINSHPDETVLREFLEFLPVRPLSPAHHRREDHDAVVALAILTAENRLDDLLGGLTGDGLAAAGTMRDADGAINQAEIVVDFGDGADGRARRARGGLLLDGDGRRKPLDGVHVRPLHLIQELTRVRRERLDIAPLPLGIDGVKGQRRLARSGQSCNHGYSVSRNLQIDVLEVVLAGAANDDLCQAHGAGGPSTVDLAYSADTEARITPQHSN